MNALDYVLFAQNDAAAGAAAAVAGVFFLLYLVMIVAIIAGMWACFVKAGKPGWAAIIPIYNIIVMLEIAGKPVWWVVLFLIPIVNLIVGVIVFIEFAKAYGKDVGWGIGLLLLGFIFFPILGFGAARYVGNRG